MSGAGQRLDKWLWYARFFRTRTLAAKVVSGGHVRVNGERVKKASSSVKQEDVLTFPQGKVIRVVRITATGTRRGPAPEAAELYEDLTPKDESPKSNVERVKRPDRADWRAAADHKRRMPT